MMATASPDSTRHPVARYLMASFAVVTCPCHLPILLLLLSGTAAGSFLSQNLGVAFMLLLPIFLLSAIATWRLLDKKEDGHQ